MTRTQTTFEAEFHPDQQRLDDVDAADAPLGEVCLAGHAWCPGQSGMFFGQFPCGTCWLHAPASAHYYHSLWENGEGGEADV